jgi:hypothetical protein
MKTTKGAKAAQKNNTTRRGSDDDDEEEDDEASGSGEEAPFFSHAQFDRVSLSGDPAQH